MVLSGSETGPWVWYGGHVGVDFVNTRRDRSAQGVEYLREPEDLARWLVGAGLVDAPPRVDQKLLAEARELREAIDAGIHATVVKAAFPVEAAEILNSWLANAKGHAVRLELDDGTAILRSPIPADDARRSLQRIALESATLLGTDARDRVRICPGPNCGGRFVDNSPAGRRRWCSMAVCGNRAKAAKHRDGTRAPAN